MSFEIDYPALYHPADADSMAGQKRFVRATRLRLSALFAAAVGGAWSLQAGSLDLFGLLGLVSFVIALGTSAYLQTTDPARHWYDGRTASEFIKTLTWRYVAGGNPFPADLSDEAADRAFRSRLTAGIDLEKLPPPQAGAPTKQITDRMRELRGGSFAQRRQDYRDGRVEEQQAWHVRKADVNERRKNTFTGIAITLEFAGVVGAAFKAFGVLDIDLLGVFSAAAAGLAAWMQARSYGDNQRAYARTAHQLGLIADELDTVTEDDWPRFVDQAENTLSSEHIQWRASKGLGAPQQQGTASAAES